MPSKWFYSHQGKSHGPFSVAEINERAAHGLITPSDKIWREGEDLAQAIVAAQAIKFDAPPAAPTPPAKPKKKRRAGSSSVSKKLRIFPPPPSAPATPAPPVPPLLAVPVPIEEVVPIPEAIPVLEAVPVLEAIPVAPPARAPVVPPAVPIALSPATAAVHEPNISLQERYRRACAALSQWADRDENLDFIVRAETEAIVSHPEVLEILRPFQDQPFEIMEKLMDHLDHMVENRSSYYRALAARQR